MQRFHAVLIAAGLAAMPANAAAGPSNDSWSTPQVFEKYELSTSRGRLGVMVMSLTPELRKHLGATDDRGVLVARVEPGTPAAAAGRPFILEGRPGSLAERGELAAGDEALRARRR